MAYATISAVRDEGLTEAMADDDRVEALLAEAIEVVERYCRRSFIGNARTVHVGNGVASASLWLPDSIISITSVTERTTEEVIPDTEYAYNGMELYLDTLSPDFTGSHGSTWWPGGLRYEVVGSLGMSETPDDINRAIILFVLKKAATIMDEMGEISPEDSRILSEKIDKYSYQLDNSRKDCYSVTGIPAMDRILNRWKRPLLGRTG